MSPETIPIVAGVYAWYRDEKRVYVGTAASLRARVWRNHLGQSQTLTASAFRRNVAEYLRFGTSAALKRREVTLTTEQLDALHAWIGSCEVAWLICVSNADARSLETRLKAEFRPCLTKR